jgi:hypothetical protein
VIEDIVDIEVVIGLPSARDALGIFLYHPDPDGHAEAQAILHANGGNFTTYPLGSIPDRTDGHVSVSGTNLYLTLGPMYVIAPMVVKSEETVGINRAVVYLTDVPFNAADQTEKTWLAVHLPLAQEGER